MNIFVRITKSMVEKKNVLGIMLKKRHAFKSRYNITGTEDIAKNYIILTVSCPGG